MLILPKSCFLHVPKTGGSWVKKAIAATNIPCRNYTLSGDPHIGIKNCPCQEKFKFAFVRHPVNLYRSYWQFKMTYEWDPGNPLDQACRSDNFQHFVRQVLDKFPGVYSNSLVEFVGETDNEIEFVGKYENLIEDLIAALKAAGEDFDEQSIRSLPPYNVSNKSRFPATYTAELEAAVKKAECNAMERFNYE
ncbi:MAG: sulfotransferase family 2 domain-containing protein [Nitrosomonas sp.]|uniref:sulfotransferase family 2 domain-containing protein n=2 Tax=Nitrosomonas sp. TaxID=42353 RepID=UPI001E02466D|nr:sulfotransferase family 2 domain-containing protein [Nitrosomonas sp.]MCB1948198.1 sulfotransferase family 2 domain-containing protein [Nitrosomonas sp.]MDR4514058.1 sulfotransferase family protein [Nitrosomonas sp.]